MRHTIQYLQLDFHRVCKFVLQFHGNSIYYLYVPCRKNKKNKKNKKSPFYVIFWKIISKHLIDCYLYSQKVGSLSNSQQQVMIILFEKKHEKASL